MKIQFDEQSYQLEAIRAITDLFEGQPVRSSHFRIDDMVGKKVRELLIGNKLELSDAEVLANVQKIQQRNGLKLSTHLHDWNFTVEMETGTGKTYVYTRTIFELNKRHGFSKFIIVVPSVAIREGVYKSLQMTEEHFAKIFAGQHCHYFKYESTNMEQVREFATSSHIEVMIINIDAFKKSFDDPAKGSKANLIHRPQDVLNGRKPIQLIQATHPIVIIDEPQSVDHTAKAKEAIASLHPLCKLRYSATHRDPYNLLYRLDPVAAYEQRLVKKIEVLSVQADQDHRQPYLKLLKVSHQKGYKATIELDVQGKEGLVTRVKKQIDPHHKNDLYRLSGEREVYHGYLVEGIDCYPGNESVQFANGAILRLGETIGVDEDWVKRQQIRATIQAHLEKEVRLAPQGIKVLTLFFIDKVGNYRLYSKGGTWQKGKYAQMFEEEYTKLIRLPRYRSITVRQAEEVHGGYFARDKLGRFKDSRVTKDGKLCPSKDDESTFSLIMMEKEKLLSLHTPLRFIFSHSALKEGWDNPNVFQICTLVETRDPMSKRQKIGRGLRLAVDQDGKRQYDEQINILTVIANESYQEFAESLQKEIEQEAGIKFNDIKQIVKEAKRGKKEDGKLLRNSGLPFNEEFDELWKRIETHKTYTIHWDLSQLKLRCITAIQQLDRLTPEGIKQKTAVIKMDHSGISSEIQMMNKMKVAKTKRYLPDLLRYLQEQTQLKRRTIVEILIKSQRLNEFEQNPQAFMEAVMKVINQEKRRLIRDGVKYVRRGDSQRYQQSLFERQELINELEMGGQQKVKLFSSLPDSFVVHTPLGKYHPSWAYLIKREGVEKLYLGVHPIK